MIVYLQNTTAIPVLTVEETPTPHVTVTVEGGDTLPPAPPDYDAPPWTPAVIPEQRPN